MRLLDVAGLLGVRWQVRSGAGDPASDPSAYVPGEYMHVHVHTLTPGFKFRGLLLHAVNGAGQTVGGWELPDEPNRQYWHPDLPSCGLVWVAGAGGRMPWPSSSHWIDPTGRGP